MTSQKVCACVWYRVFESYLGFGYNSNDFYSLNYEVWKGGGCATPEYLPSGMKLSYSKNLRVKQFGGGIQISLWPIFSRFIKKEEGDDNRWVGYTGYRQFGNSKIDLQMGLNANWLHSENSGTLSFNPEIGVKLHLFSRFWLKGMYTRYLPISNKNWQQLDPGGLSKQEVNLYLLVDLIPNKSSRRPKSLFPRKAKRYRMI